MKGLKLTLALLLGSVCATAFGADPPRLRGTAVRSGLTSTGQTGRRYSALPRRGNKPASTASHALSRSPTVGPAHFMPVLSLKILQGSGDFSQWVTSTIVERPRKMLLRWTNNLPNANGVQWQVSAVPLPGDNPSMNQPGVLKTGWIQPVAKGKSTIFAVPFQSILPANPPAQPTKYFTRIVALTTPDNKAVVATTAVTVVYQQPSNVITHFTPQGLGQTVKQQHAWMYNNSPMPIEIDLKELYVGNSNESADEPYLVVAILYVDGTTINPLNFQNSTVRIDCPSKTHGNVPDEDKYGNDLETAKTARIPKSTGHFEKTIVPIGYGLADNMEDVDGKIGQAMADNTCVYIVVIGMEEDATSTSAINAARAAMLNKLQNAVNGIVHQLSLSQLQSGEFPVASLQELQQDLQAEALDAAKSATLVNGWWVPFYMPLLIAQVTDPDDFVGFAYRKVTMAQLLAAGTSGISLNLGLANSADWEGAYTVRGRIRRKN